MTSYRFRITGTVQGVWYRKTVRDKANNAGFSGCVRNLSDGSVEACATLHDDDFATFIAILEEGSPKSRVECIEQEVVFELYSGPFIVL